MAIVNMSVDTNTRDTSVTVDGVLVPAVECSLSKFVDSDGVKHISLSYTIESENNGLVERKIFFLPAPMSEESVGSNGLASKTVAKNEQFANDLLKYLKGK